MSDDAAMTPMEIRQVAAESLALGLSGAFPGWTTSAEGLVGPGTLAITLTGHAGMPPEHVDIGFVLNRERDDAPVIWDCAAGLGANPVEKVGAAVNTWMVSTFPAIRELLVGRGEYADHMHGGDPDGLRGWHVVHGPITTVGGPEAAALSQWVLDNPLLPQLPELSEAMERPWVNGVKLVLGPVCEVRVNGQVNDECTRALDSLAWPRAKDGYVRCFVIGVHPEPLHDSD